MQMLSLKGCERITDAGIKALCKGAAARSLQHLDVNGCDRLTDAAAVRMAASLHQLRILSLEHCKHFTSRYAPASSRLLHGDMTLALWTLYKLQRGLQWTLIFRP